MPGFALKQHRGRGGYLVRLDLRPDHDEAWQNGYAERLIRTIKDYYVDLSDYQEYHSDY